MAKTISRLRLLRYFGLSIFLLSLGFVVWLNAGGVFFLLIGCLHLGFDFLLLARTRVRAHQSDFSMPNKTPDDSKSEIIEGLKISAGELIGACLMIVVYLVYNYFFG